MPYVRMDAKPQGYHWGAHNACTELKEEKSEYKFAICVFKRKGMGSRIFKLTINLQQAKAQLSLPRTAIKSEEHLPNPRAETNHETWKMRQVNAPDFCKQLPEGSLRGTSLPQHSTLQLTEPQTLAWVTLCEMRTHHFWLLWVTLYLQCHPRSESGPSVFGTCLELDSKWASAEDKSY